MKRCWIALIGLSMIAAVLWVWRPQSPPEGVILSGTDTLTIEQLSNRAIIENESFSVEEGEAIRFQGPKPDSNSLIWVKSKEPVRIDGKITSNHPVQIMAEGGVEIGPNAVIHLKQEPEP